MAGRAPIQIRYNPVRTSPGTVQNSFVGAQTVIGQRGVLPTFTNANAVFFAKTGSDSNPGTMASPFLTATKALSSLAGAIVYAVCLDSGVYNEAAPIVVNYSANANGGLFAADGQNPTIAITRGAVAGTFGARATGRTKFSTGASASFFYVSKAGNNGTGTRGNPALPFLTIQGALSSGSRLAGDTIQIQDSGAYVEDINAAATPVIIQAAAGQVPTLVGAGGANHITANTGIAVFLYGLNIVDPIGEISVSLSASSDFYDCSFNGGLIQLALGGAATYNVINCLCTGSQNQTISAEDINHATTVNVTNTLFLSCTIGLALSVIQMHANGVNNPAFTDTLTLTGCSFINCNSPQSIILLIGGTAAGTATTYSLTVTSCVFSDTRGSNATATTGMLLNGGFIGASSAITIANSLFSGLGGPAYNDATTGTSAGFPLNINTSAFVGLTSRVASTADVTASSATTGHNTFLNLTFIRSAFAGIQLNVGATSATIMNCAFLNCGSFGINVVNVTTTITSCVEANSGTAAVQRAGGAAVTVSFCVFKSVITASISIGVAFFTADPLFLSTAKGTENVGLSAASLAVDMESAPFAGSATSVNMGPLNPTIKIATANHAFAVNGFIFSGDPMFTDGVQVISSVVSPVSVSYCTFTGLAGQGIILAAPGAGADHCLMTALNGMAINVSASGVTVFRCVGQNCVGTFLVIGAVSVTVNHCTGYGCEYGEFDLAGSGGVVTKNNVFSGNGAADYNGSNIMTTSDVSRISGTGIVTGTRKNPLFRDTSVPDLRLQTVEFGFPFDSPAKLLADDGTDAGAFAITYGPVILTWTLVDFATGAGNPDLAYRNPHHLVRAVQPLKLAEGETFGGVTFSTAPAFKTEHMFKWDPDTNMPVAQVNDLILIYQTGDGETQLSFDAGVTFIPTRVIRSTAHEREEIEGAFYSDDTLPTPVKELKFREST